MLPKFSAIRYTATLVVMGASMLALSPAAANAAPPPSLIENAAYSQCIDAPGGAFNVQLKLVTCNASDLTQNWGFVKAGADDTYFIVNQKSLLCMEVNNGTSTPKERVDEFTCNGSASEQWVLEGLNLRHAGTNQCLDTVGGPGSQLMQYTCGQAAPAIVQAWIPSPFPQQDKSYKVQNCNNGTLNGGVVGSTMTVWASDLTTSGRFVEYAVLPGIRVGHLCGPRGDVPNSYTFLPQANHVYEVRVVEVDQKCTIDSPTSPCIASDDTFQGQTSGQAIVKTIS